MRDRPRSAWASKLPSHHCADVEEQNTLCVREGVRWLLMAKVLIVDDNATNRSLTTLLESQMQGCLISKPVTFDEMTMKLTRTPT